MATTMTTSTASYATSGGRLVALTSGGTIWTALYDLANTRWTFWYSTNDGTSFTENTNLRLTASATDAVGALVISDNDWMWFACSNGTSAGLFRYTDSAITTTYSAWDQTNTGEADITALDMCVVKKTGGTIYYTACVLYYETTGTDSTKIKQFRVPSTGGAPTGTATSNFISGTALQVDVAIDWSHTGDGKTPTSSTPSVFAAVRSSEAGEGVVLQRWYESGTTGTYEAKGGERVIDTTESTSPDSLTGISDGARFVMAFVDDDGDTLPKVYQRDYADTTTTSLPTAGSIPALSDGAITAMSIAVLDDGSTGDFRLYAVGTTSDDVKMTEYDRSADTFSAWATVATTTATANTLSAQRGSRNSGVSLLWTSGSGSPYDIVWERDSVNTAPTAPTWLTPADGSAQDETATLPVTWQFNDSDGDTQGAYALKRTISATTTYFRASDSTFQVAEVKNTSSTEGVTLPATWDDAGSANVDLSVKTWDAADVEGVYGDTITLIPSTPVTPALTAPADSSTITGPTPTITWTATEQTAYRVRWLDGAAVLYDSGKITSTTKSITSPYSLENGATGLTVEARVWNDDDLEGATDSHTGLDVTFTEPMTPTIAVTAVPASGRINIVITDPTPTGSPTPPTVTGHDLFVRVAAGGVADGERPVGGDGIRIIADDAGTTLYDYAAGSGIDYEYRVLSAADDGTGTYSAWT